VTKAVRESVSCMCFRDVGNERRVTAISNCGVLLHKGAVIK